MAAATEWYRPTPKINGATGLHFIWMMPRRTCSHSVTHQPATWPPNHRNHLDTLYGTCITQAQRHKQGDTTMPYHRTPCQTLAYIDHPNNEGWKLHFCSDCPETYLQYEVIDQDGNVVMWERLTRQDPWVEHYMSGTGSSWRFNLPLLGHYRITPAPYAWDVYKLVTEERPIRSSNSFQPVER